MKKTKLDKFHEQFATISGHHNVPQNEHIYFHTDNKIRAERGLQDVINKIDSDIRDTVIETPAQRADLAFAMYCTGFLPSLNQGDSLDPPSVQAIAFLYSVYWHMGDDFVLGNCVDTMVRDLGRPDAKKVRQSHENELDEESTRLGFEIWEAMYELFRSHYRPKHGLKINVPDKPKFRDDFRVRALHLTFQTSGLWECNHDFSLDEFIMTFKGDRERIAIYDRLTKQPLLATGRCVAQGIDQAIFAANTGRTEKGFKETRALLPALKTLPNYDDFRDFTEFMITAVAPNFRKRETDIPGRTKDEVFEKRMASIAKVVRTPS